MVHRSYRHSAHGHGPGQTLPEIYALQHILAVGVQVPYDLGHPAVDADLVRLAGMPDVHGSEVGAGRVLESDAVDDCQLAVVIEVFKRVHIRPETQLVIYGHNQVFGDVDLGPVVPVQAIGIGNDRVQVIVGAGELQDDQHRVFFSCRHSYSPLGQPRAVH